ncbi:galactoside O-acetyltransferase [Agrilactobacillus composti DSM 18527 = JCM 14202]|uniref:Acetyltransferase n=1 Tax=Agrilactobacillus composti DSM 18527 = JCM 14202 TaxID=1423734 RepID=X0PD27_9LACO|nr:sugar O-acetyltransferase [Agrilactobacillus composti]KRM33031.1 galactoside O-acetyltransferase [Agrilactobacillus composti DSM 18527 = JCM 14202]GAF38623.1 galactoside O-acetyltransferase [Agrilactobacillus composti DSM 18527 = JCM 14202]
MDNLSRKKQHLPYHYDDPKLMGQQQAYLELLYAYNQTRPSQSTERQQLLTKMLASIGSNCHIEPPLHANWGAHNLHLGSGCYINFNLTLVDDADIYIGNDCMISPNVVIATSGHPILPKLRLHNYVYNFPVTLGDNVWIGSGAQILPGVSIGDNTVIGAGSVVDKDIPAYVVAYGSPCRVARAINDQDKTYYFKNHQLDVWD